MLLLLLLLSGRVDGADEARASERWLLSGRWLFSGRSACGRWLGWAGGFDDSPFSGDAGNAAKLRVSAGRDDFGGFSGESGWKLPLAGRRGEAVVRCDVRLVVGFCCSPGIAMSDFHFVTSVEDFCSFRVASHVKNRSGAWPAPRSRTYSRPLE